MVNLDMKSNIIPKFNVGDKITYIDRNKLPKKEYYFGGENLGAFIGIITGIREYIDEAKCFKIRVTIPEDHYSYEMLESEFEEYKSFKKHNAFTTMLLNRRKFKLNNNGKSKWESRTSI